MRPLTAIVLALVPAALLAQVATDTTVGKAGSPRSNAVTVQTNPSAPLAVTGSFSATSVEASVTSTGNNVPGQATYVAGSSTGGKLLAPYVMTSTPSGTEPGFVVRMPAGASGLTNTELRAAPVSVVQWPQGVTSTQERVQAQDFYSGQWGVFVMGGKTDTGEPLVVPVVDGSSPGATRLSIPVTGVEGAPVAVSSTQSGTWSNVGVIGTFWPQSQTSTIAYGSVTSTLALNSAVSSTLIGPLGQTTMAASLPVVLASNQSTVSVTSTSSQLPASLGQKAMSASLPVVLASNQSTVSVTSTSSQLPASLGQKAMSASLPVVLASDQSVVSVTSSLAQGATLAGQGQFLAGAGVTSTRMVYTGATVRPLAVSPNGALLVSAPIDFPDYTTLATSTTATALTRIITAVSGSRTLIKQWTCSSSAASTTTADQWCGLKYGTGTNCATGTVRLAGCMTTATSTCAIPDIVVPASQDVCYMHAAAGTKLFTFTYLQAP